MKRIDKKVQNLERISESVFVGTSGHTNLFYTDLREPNTVNYFRHIDSYRNKRQNELLSDAWFCSLSCNKTNPYEFAVGTTYNVKIFDFRQMKPRYEFHHCPNNIRGHQFHVSWSTNGKYILVKDEEVFDRKNEELYFFWDVRNAERIIMPTETRPWVDYCFNPDTWIDDHLIVASTKYGVKAISPFYETKVIEEPQYTGRYPRYMAYNEKTLQLAEGDGQKISIFSHYKLPPYPHMSSIQ